MSGREQLDPDASLWDWIAVDLHFWRSRQRLSTSALGAAVGLSRQQVSNIENGRRRLDEGTAAKLDQMWDLNGHFERLIRYARSGHDPDWFRQHLHLESMASDLRIWEPMRIPGLLQTADYARCLLVSGGSPDPDEAVSLRLSRQDMLTRHSPPAPWVWILMDEQVIRRPMGGQGTMAGQLGHLLKMSELPRIAVQVVPISVGWHAGLDSAFKIMNVKGQTYAYTEAAEGGRLVSSITDVDLFALRYDQIRAQALPVDLSRELISQTMESIS